MTNVYDPYPDPKYTAQTARRYGMKVAAWRKACDVAADELHAIMGTLGAELKPHGDTYLIELKHGKWEVDRMSYGGSHITTRFSDGSDIEGLSVMQNGFLIRYKWNHHHPLHTDNVTEIRTMAERILEKDWLRK